MRTVLESCGWLWMVCGRCGRRDGEAEAKAPGASSSPTALGCTLCYITLVYYPGGWRSLGARRTGPRTYLAAADDLTPNLRVCEYFAHLGQRGLAIARPRMRGTEDPPPPLDHVLEYTLGFEQVAACVEISLLVSADWCWFKRRWSRVHSGWSTRAAARRRLIFSVSS